RKSAIVSVFVCWQALHWALLNGEVADRWQSGRMYLTRNQAYVQAYRGFESHPVRHRIFQSSPKKTKDPVETSIYGVFCFQGGPTGRRAAAIMPSCLRPGC